MYHIKNIYIKNSVRDSEPARRARDRFSPESIHYFNDHPAVPEGCGIKENLIISENKGGFVKPCPCTSHYTGCGYTVLNYMHNCPLTCSYCILQAYLNEPGIILYANWNDIEQDLKEKVWNPGRNLRVGTGELGDSLALEPLCGFAAKLIHEFAQENGILELKTKSTEIDSLLNLDHKGKTILAWSVNAPHIIQTEETDTASLEERVQAARKALDAGYGVAFHLDPALDFPGWKKGYADMFEKLSSYINPGDRVVWFSIGGMRFMPLLKKVVAENHPDSIVTSGEFIDGLDGKKRYYKKVREELFAFLYTQAQKVFPQAAVYYCMESEDIWKKTTGCHPGSRGLAEMLDETVF